MSALLLAIKKIIAVLTAIFVPAASATPVIPQFTRVVTASIFDTREVIDSSTMVIEEDPEDEDPADDPEEEYMPVKTWDVSATENDNVTMSFYDTEDTETLLEHLAGRVTALFAPLTAYAAEEYEDDDVYIVEDGNGMFEFHKNDVYATGNVENGAPGEEGQPAPEDKIYDAGTLVISGEGDMMEAVYNYFVDPYRYIDTIVGLFAEYEGKTVVAANIEELDLDNVDLITLDRTVKFVNVVTGEVEGLTEAMFEHFNPADMLRYKPTKVIIEEGVTNISDHAFVFCANIIEVTFKGAVEEIGEGAFEYCEGLTTITIPATVKHIGEAAFSECTNLRVINFESKEEDVRFYCSTFEGIHPNAEFNYEVR